MILHDAEWFTEMTVPTYAFPREYLLSEILIEPYLLQHLLCPVSFLLIEWVSNGVSVLLCISLRMEIVSLYVNEHLLFCKCPMCLLLLF